MSERSIAAAQLLRSLNALDPHNLERAELATAGVSRHRVALLYPRTFDTVAQGLLPHMRKHGVTHLPALNGRMDERIATRSQAISSLPTELLDQWKQLGDSRRERGFVDLHKFIREQIGNGYEGYSVANNFNALLARAWWLAMRRPVLPPHLQVNSDLTMAWISANLLPQLVADVEGGRA